MAEKYSVVANPTFWLVVALAVIVIGFCRALGTRTLVQNQLELLQKYLEHLNGFCAQTSESDKHYTYLIQHSQHMQELLGEYGKIDFTPPFSGRTYRGHLIILNFIPELRRIINKAKLDSHSSTELEHAVYYEQTTKECLIRFFGILQTRERLAIENLRNPLEWFRQGVERIIAIPIQLLSMVGIISPRQALFAEQSLIVRFASGVVTLVGVGASLVTIAQGWPVIERMIQN